MPPRKVAEPKHNVVALGRLRKNLEMGCVGVSTVGKSSLFNPLTGQNAAAENCPFCTIELNEARCAVPGIRYAVLQISLFRLRLGVEVYVNGMKIGL